MRKWNLRKLKFHTAVKRCSNDASARLEFNYGGSMWRVEFLCVCNVPASGLVKIVFLSEVKCLHGYFTGLKFHLINLTEVWFQIGLSSLQVSCKLLVEDRQTGIIMMFWLGVFLFLVFLWQFEFVNTVFVFVARFFNGG